MYRQPPPGFQGKYICINGQRSTPPPQIAQQMQIRTTASLLALTLLIYLVFSNVLPVVLLWGFSLLLSDVYSVANRFSAPRELLELVNLLSYSLSYLLPFLGYALMLRMPLRVAVPLRAPKVPMGVGAVCIGLGVSVLGSFASQALARICAVMGFLPISPDFSAPSGTAATVLYAVTLVVAAPFLEEFVFRGVILQSLRRFGDSFAILISSLLFALMHGNLSQAPNAFLMGMVIGFFVVRSSSLWTGIAMHMANNLMTLILLNLTAALPVNRQVVLQNSFMLVYLLLGVLALIMLLRRYTGLFVLKCQTSVLTQPQKLQSFFSSVLMLCVVGIYVFFLLRNLQLIR